MSWEKFPISEVCSHVVDCVNRTAPVVDYETPYKMLRTTNVRGGFVDTENVRYVTLETYERWTRRLVPERGDVFLTREAPLGDVGRLTSDDKVFLGQRLFHYRANPKRMDSRFLAYVLQSPGVQGWIKGVGMGATVEHARVGDFQKIPVPTPPLGVQEKIGDILSAYDDLIENNQRRIALLEDAARQLYKEWFVRFRFPGHEHSKIIDGIPEGWKRTTAADVMDILSGGTPKTTTDEFWGGDIPFYTPKDSSESIYVMDTEKTLTERGLSSCASKLYPKNTLFITARGTVGKLNLAQAPMAMNQSCYALVGRGTVTQTFLYFSLNARIDQLKSRAVGAVFDAIIKDTFNTIPYLLPTTALIRDFSEIVEPNLQQVDVLLNQNRLLTRARDLLLPKLMNGEITV